MKKTRMGRPFLPDDKRLDKRVDVSLSAKVYAWLKGKAETKEEKVSATARGIIERASKRPNSKGEKP